MADRYPLIVDSTSENIKELPTGDAILFLDNEKIKVGTGSDLTVYHDASNSYITNAVGALKVATETSGIAVTIGHTTSETTIADNLTVTGTLTGTLATAAQGSVTSLGTLTALTVDNLGINGNTITANSGAVNITPAGGSAIVLDGTINVDAGVVTGATSVTSTAFVGALTGNASTATLATTATVTDSTANTNFPVVFNNESNALLDDTGALRYNPSTGTLLVPNLSVAGTTTTVDTVTMEASNAIIFEGATADNYETTLSIVDPTADHTQYLINQGGYIPVLAAATTTAITSTPAELNLLDGVSGLVQADFTKLAAVDSTAAELNIIDGGTSATGTTLAAADRLIVNDNGTMVQVALSDFETFFESAIDTFSTIDINGGSIDGATVGANSASSGAFTTLSASGALTGTLGTAAQTNVTSLGTLTALTVDDVAINGKVITMTGSTDDTATLTVGTNGTLAITTVDTAAAAANMILTADGTFEAVGSTITLDSGGAINLEPASGSAILLDGTISVDAGVVTGATSITSTAFVGDITGDVTGNASGTALTVTQAAQTAITSLGTLTGLTGGTGDLIWDTDTLFVDSSADMVGIGTTTPGGLLETNHATDNTKHWRIHRPGTAEFGIGVAGSYLHISDSSSMPSGSSKGIYLKFNTGEVGIGVPAPTTYFSVAKSANITQVALTSSSAAVAWDAKAAANAYHVTTENTTFSAPSNPVEGAIISVELAQGGTARTIAWNTVFEFAASTAPTITATASKTDILSFRYNGSVWQEIGRVQNMAQT